MKKIMALAVVLALMLAAAPAAFAGGAVGGDFELLAVDASQSQVAAAFQTNTGDAVADANGLGSAADASIDQSLTIDQSQVNGGVGGVAAGGDVFDGDLDNDGILDDLEVVVVF